MLTPPVAALLAFLTGVVLEVVVAAAAGRREAWDSPIFFVYGLPAAFAVSFGIGVFSKGRAWLGTLALVPGQIAAMTLRAGEIGTLWPLGLALSAVLSAPFAGAAFVGWKLRGNQRTGTATRPSRHGGPE
jgi:hypothetical protein